VARFWIVPYNTGWHLAHHVDMGVPWRNLPAPRRAGRAGLGHPRARVPPTGPVAGDADDSVDVAVLTGANGVFCAGADLKGVSDGRGNRVVDRHDRRRSHGTDPHGPVQAGDRRGRGFAVAGGLELAVWCDLRVVADDATFGVYCRRWGVPLIDGGTVRLPRLVGHGRAMDMILTGRGVGADEARAIGLADRVVASGHRPRAAVALAHELSALPQHCMRSDRRSAIDQWSLDHSAAMANETRLGLEVIDSGETLEGAARFAAGSGRHGAPAT
jgi:enoyl-CoA hydratase